MQKRYSVKDFILYGFLSLVIILIIVMMYQVDRQWSKLSEATQVLSSQAKDVSNLRISIAQLEKKFDEKKRSSNCIVF